MKTSVIEVHGMLLALSADAVEKRIRKVPGVESVTVNDVAGNATVRYDETLLDIADIKAAVHQSEYQTAGESEPKHLSEHKPAGKSAAVTTPQAAPAPALTPVAVVPKTSAVAPAAVPKTPTPMPPPAGDGQQDKAVPSAPPSATVAATPKPSPVAPAAAGQDGHEGHTASAAPAAGAAAPNAKPATPVSAAPKAAVVVPAVVPAPLTKSSLPAPVEPKADSWKVHALSLATTLGVAYISCAIFDLVFPPFGLLAALAPASPLPISGSALGFLTGFALFTVAGLVLGALYGIVSEFWSKRLH